MAPHYKTHPVLPSGRQFWCKIRRQTKCGTFIPCLKKHFTKVSEDLEGKLYCGITIDWNCIERWVGISMPGYKNGCGKDRNTFPPRKCNIAPTEHSQKFTAQRHKTPCPWTIPPSLMMNEKNWSNKSSVVFYIIEGKWI